MSERWGDSRQDRESLDRHITGNYGEDQYPDEDADASHRCRVYWGSHGCRYERGHEGSHECCCATDGNPNVGIDVGKPPYYGPETRFYGEDAEALGLPLVSNQYPDEDEDACPKCGVPGPAHNDIEDCADALIDYYKRHP